MVLQRKQEVFDGILDRFSFDPAGSSYQQTDTSDGGGPMSAMPRQWIALAKIKMISASLRSPDGVVKLPCLSGAELRMLLAEIKR